MATIEPRLIHLLNDSTPELANIDLPPFHTLPFREAGDGPLPPLERDGTRRIERPGAETQVRLGATHLTGDDDSFVDGTYAGNSEVLPMRMLLRDAENNDHFHPLAPIIDDLPELTSDDASKKRNRTLVTRDDYLQLPNPVKKQKPAAHVVPPIINGLHEPPPHAALFPPIESNSFSDGEANHLPSIQEPSSAPGQGQGSGLRSKDATPPREKPAKGRKKASKPRRKWTEEETNHLLLGVNKHGVGQWTFILEDQEFKFNARSAGDLKDRFRTCCPAELRGAKGSHGTTTSSKTTPKPKKGLHSENILLDDEDSSATGGMVTPPDSDAPSKFRKPRAHRKRMEDLESLGISSPFKKSSRRARTPFTDQDDREILEGLEKYGPAWTKIQRDPAFHLQSRQPTDLRDRVRNKHPEVYKRIDASKGSQAKNLARGNDTMEPSVNMSIDNSFKPSSINRTNSKEELHRAPFQLGEPIDPNTSLQGLENGDGAASQWLGGEMGISRLLLHDTKPALSM